MAEDASTTSDDRWASPEAAVAYGSSLLVGQSTRLRSPCVEDLDLLASWFVDARFSVLQAGRFRIDSAAEAREQIAAWASNKNVVGGGSFVVESLRDGETIGAVNLWGGTLPVRAATLAIQIAPDAVGQGYGTDAVRTAIGFGFRELGLNRIQLEVSAFNSRAVRAYEKAGFSVEGRRRQALFHDDRFHDQLIMAVLADDWRAGRG